MGKIKSMAWTTLLIGTLAIAGGHGSHGHWGYGEENGPKHWSELSKNFEMCGIGKNQSPIDINEADTFDTDLPPIKFRYQSHTKDIVDNGHTEQVDIKSDSSITIDGKTFELKQFHFHVPSENTINGKHFPMEAHFVHVDKKGDIAVVAVMFQKSDKENPALEKFWSKLPTKAGEKVKIDIDGKDVENILPIQRDYYRFNGSLTTPPCTEGVRWFVLKTPVPASKGQIEKFTKILHMWNNRPVQSINARKVLK